MSLTLDDLVFSADARCGACSNDGKPSGVAKPRADATERLKPFTCANVLLGLVPADEAWKHWPGGHDGWRFSALPTELDPEAGGRTTRPR